MKIAVIGATGVVGQKMLQVLEEQNLSFDELIVAASEKSIGKKILFKDKEMAFLKIAMAETKDPDLIIKLT